MTNFGYILAILLFRIDSLITAMHKFTKYITGGHIHIFSKICTIIRKQKKIERAKISINLVINLYLESEIVR